MRVLYVLKVGSANRLFLQLGVKLKRTIFRFSGKKYRPRNFGGIFIFAEIFRHFFMSENYTD